MQNNIKRKLVFSIMTFATIIVILFIGILIFETIDMLIDHQCYQLEPNDFYNSTICEKYWKDESRKTDNNK